MAMILCLLFAGCGETGDTSSDQAEAFDITTAEDSPEFVSKLDQAKDANQLFVVACIGQTTAYVSMHQKDEDGNWKQIITTPGYIGKNGLGKTKEGDAMTPVGTYSFNYAFGINPDPGCTAFEYQQVTDDDYWSGDQREGYGYNTMVNIKDLPDLNTEDSEHIVDYPVHYQYCLNISFNKECKIGKGSAIFLHCTGNTKYTSGCVSIPKSTMLKVMKRVKPGCVVIINTTSKLKVK